jgi:hypothetical protein
MCIIENEKPSRFIDGSKTCSRLVEDHLQHHWCATNMNLFLGHNNRINGFIHGDFLLEFRFRSEDDKFTVYTVLYHPQERGPIDDLDEKLQAVRDEITDRTLKLKVSTDGAIVLVQKVSAASLLADEDFEHTLDEFFRIARSTRKSVMPLRKRRLSWFSKSI